MKTEEIKLKCVCLKGELSNQGNHILLPTGVTLCGMPTVDADLTIFPQLKNEAFSDLISDYAVKEWEITCERCIDMIKILKPTYQP